MIVKVLTIFIVCFLAIGSCAQKRASSLTTPIIVQRHGYPVEEHTVQTSDGYILTIHRIPYSPKSNNGTTQRRPVAFLFHGILCSSSIWVLSGPEKSLAYILSDAGYDVWMGNARGNVYSREHITLNHSLSDFWNFEWHHMGIYDIPAMIDYIIGETGEAKVRYFGHSQGSKAFLVLNSEVPSYKNRFRSAHLLAPVAFFNNSPSAIAVRFSPVLGQPNPDVEEMGCAELLPSSRVLERLGAVFCRDGLPTQVLCSSLLFLFAGGPSPFLNRTLLPEIAAIMPAGISINQIYHLLQLKNSGRFCQFDYGPIRNLAEYGSITAPDYNLQNLDVPTYLYYSDNDDLADPIDVNRLILALNGTNALKGAYRVPLPLWNHMDFLFGLGVENVVYSVVMDDISNS